MKNYPACKELKGELWEQTQRISDTIGQTSLRYSIFRVCTFATQN